MEGWRELNALVFFGIIYAECVLLSMNVCLGDPPLTRWPFNLVSFFFFQEQGKLTPGRCWPAAR